MTYQAEDTFGYDSIDSTPFAPKPVRKETTRETDLLSCKGPSDVLEWLRKHNFDSKTCSMLRGYDCSDLLRLSREDTKDLLGATDGIRLYNIIRKSKDRRKPSENGVPHQRHRNPFASPQDIEAASNREPCYVGSCDRPCTCDCCVETCYRKLCVVHAHKNLVTSHIYCEDCFFAQSALNELGGKFMSTPASEHFCTIS